MCSKMKYSLELVWGFKDFRQEETDWRIHNIHSTAKGIGGPSGPALYSSQTSHLIKLAE